MNGVLVLFALAQVGARAAPIATCSAMADAIKDGDFYSTPPLEPVRGESFSICKKKANVGGDSGWKPQSYVSFEISASAGAIKDIYVDAVLWKPMHHQPGAARFASAVRAALSAISGAEPPPAVREIEKISRSATYDKTVQFGNATLRLRHFRPGPDREVFEAAIEGTQPPPPAQ